MRCQPCRIQLYLKLAGKRSDGYLAKTYDTTDARSIHMMWLENYINEHYTDQIKLVDKPPPQPQNQDEELPPAQPLQIAQPTPPLSPSRDSSAGGGGRPAAIDVGGASSVPLGAPPSPEKMRTRATTIAAAEPVKAGGPRGWSRLKSADIRKDFGAERRRSPTMKDVVEEASPRSRSQTRDEPQPQPQPQPEPEPPSEGAPREAEAPGERRPSVAAAAAAPQPALFTQTPSAQPTAAAVPPSPSGSWPPAPGGGAVLSVRDSRAAMLARARTAAQARGAGGQRNMYCDSPRAKKQQLPLSSSPRCLE